MLNKSISERNTVTLARVAIVSEQAIILRGLQSLVLSISGLSLVGQAANAAEALQLCSLSTPDLILIDLKTVLVQGPTLVEQIHASHPQTRVVLLLDTEEEYLYPENVETGSLYLMSRDVSEDEFRDALNHICQTGPTSGPAHVHHHPDAAEELLPALPPPPLPVQRNQEVLTRELVMAGRIQTDILPEEAPNLYGWDIAARLLPARETSGDFYDFIPMQYGKWGIVIGDVTDKGMGAALFMALTSTLIRTYATRYPTLPALALSAVNERILNDTRGGMFVTTFFGILEPTTGRFVFANAGHPPGYQIGMRRTGQSIDSLRHTGMALGVSDEAQWRQKAVKIFPGDLLVLYTDGITEAQNAYGAFYGEDRLADTVLSMPQTSAREIQDALLEDVRQFEHGSSRQDDIAVIIIKRES